MMIFDITRGVQKTSEAIFCKVELCGKRKAKERWPLVFRTPENIRAQAEGVQKTSEAIFCKSALCGKIKAKDRWPLVFRTPCDSPEKRSAKDKRSDLLQ
ncbi:MAG: hypothetical protein GY795_41345 [Desulfobacterales bacterium]|nr:hypothetical protein [Desulfobacterales bacterium]